MAVTCKNRRSETRAAGVYAFDGFLERWRNAADAAFTLAWWDFKGFAAACDRHSVAPIDFCGDLRSGYAMAVYSLRDVDPNTVSPADFAWLLADAEIDPRPDRQRIVEIFNHHEPHLTLDAAVRCVRDFAARYRLWKLADAFIDAESIGSVMRRLTEEARRVVRTARNTG